MQNTTTSPLTRLMIIIIITLLLILFRPPADTWAAGGAEMESVRKPLSSSETLAKPMTEANPEAFEAAIRHDEDLNFQVAKQANEERAYAGAAPGDDLRKIGEERRARIHARQNAYNTLQAAAPVTAFAAADETISGDRSEKVVIGFSIFIFLSMIFWRVMFGRRRYVP